MEKKTKIWLIVGLIIIAIIISLAIYKGVGLAKTTSVSTGGGTTTTSNNGLGDIAKQIFSWF